MNVHEMNELDSRGRTLLHHACESGNIAMVQLLHEHTRPIGDINQRTALLVAAHFGHVEIVEILMRTPHAVSAMEEDTAGITAYQLIVALVGSFAQAIEQGDFAKIELWNSFHQQRASTEFFNEQDCFGNTALHEAIGVQASFDWLIRHGAVSLPNSSKVRIRMFA
jgi:hypothetical protein